MNQRVDAQPRVSQVDDAGGIGDDRIENDDETRRAGCPDDKQADDQELDPVGEFTTTRLQSERFKVMVIC